MEIIQGIYKIENTNTGRVYIGQSKNIYNRFQQHKTELKSNTHHSLKLQRSYNKTSDKNVFKFSVVEIVNDEKMLNEREQHYIDYYDSYNNGYNCCNVGVFPNNEKNNIKNIKRKYYQDLFHSFASHMSVNVGDTRLEKINSSKGYSWQTIRRLCVVLKYFYDNYDIKKYSLSIGMYNNDFSAYIHDENDEFIKKINFVTRNKKYIPEYCFEKLGGIWKDSKIENTIIDQCEFYA